MKRIPKRTKSVHAGLDCYMTPDFIPSMALIVHADRRHGGATCCTAHKIERDGKGRSKLLPGTLATVETLSGALADAVKGIGDPDDPSKELRRPSGYASRDVLFRSGTAIAWLRPATVEKMLIDGKLGATHSGKPMAVPEMIFIVDGYRLRTLCSLSPGRPGPEAEVCPAPFPNTSRNGVVCLNGGLNFGIDTPGYEEKVEELYFGTVFTHPNMSHPLNSAAKLDALWTKAIAKAEAGETLIPSDFITDDYPKFKLKEILGNAN